MFLSVEQPVRALSVFKKGLRKLSLEPRSRIFAVGSPPLFEVRAPLGDHITKHIATGSPYEAGLLRAVSRIVSQGFFVDCGAHIGNHSLFLAAHGWTGASFEPNSSTFKFLVENINRNGFSRSVAVFNIGLGSASGYAQISDGPIGNSGESHLEVSTDGSIPLLPLDEFGMNPDLVKIDVNGFELDVLKGMADTLRRTRPVVVVVRHSGAREIARLLRPYGYVRVGGSWASSPTYIFVARRTHKRRSLLLASEVARAYLRRTARSRVLAPPRRAYSAFRRLSRLLPQRLSAARRLIGRDHREFLKRLNVSHASTQSAASRRSDLVVSMTSFPARISSAWIAIESLMDQSLSANEIVLCLGRDEFPSGRLPWTLERYTRFGLRILWIDKTARSYDKLIPIRLEFPEATIVTVDDDVIYDRDWLSDLVTFSNEFPRAVVGHRGWEVAWSTDGPAPYRTWLPATAETPPRDVFLTGVGGILYPPHLPSVELLCDVELAQRICPTADDVWFWAANRQFGVEQRCSGQSRTTPVWQFVEAPRLEDVNVAGGRNDVQVAAVLGRMR